MTYATHIFSAANGNDQIAVKAKTLVEFDRALSDQDARIAVLEAAVADLQTRVAVLEGP